MKKITISLLSVVLLFTFFIAANPAKADMVIASETRYLFHKDGMEYNKPLEFTYDCYGYSVTPPNFEVKDPGTYTPEKVFSQPYDGGRIDCPSYGCIIEGANGPYSAKYRHMDYCIFNIYSEGQTFQVKKADLEDNCTETEKFPIGLSCSTTINIVSEGSTTINDPKPDQVIGKDEKDIPPEYKDTGLPLNPVPESTTKYISLFIIALLATIIIETLVLLLLLKSIWKKEGSKIRVGKIVFAGVVASALTIPYLWFVLPEFFNGATYILIGEALVVLVESLIIFWILKLKWPLALVLSFICNLASFFLGWLIMSKLF